MKLVARFRFPDDGSAAGAAAGAAAGSAAGAAAGSTATAGASGGDNASGAGAGSANSDAGSQAGNGGAGAAAGGAAQGQGGSAASGAAAGAAAGSQAGAGVAAGAAAGAGAQPYTLTLPENAVIGNAVLERTAATVRPLGLSNEHAQAIANLVNQEVAAFQAAHLEAHMPGGAKWVEHNATRKAAALADPEIGGSAEKLAQSVALAERALSRFGTDASRKFLTDAGLLSEPEAVRLLARIGKAMGEGTLITATPTPAPKSDADLFYPKKEAASAAA